MAVAIASGLLTFGASQAQATTIFDLGTLTAAHPLSKSVTAPKGSVDDEFDFVVAAPLPLEVYAQFLDFKTPGSGLFTYGNLALYMKPGGLISGSIAPILVTPVADYGMTKVFDLLPGSYSVNVTGSVASNLGANFSLGVFGASVVGQNGGVPEPSAWALMITGVALVGAALRTRPKTVAQLS